MAFTEGQRALIDVVTKMIDAPLRTAARDIRDVYQAMTQVPWNVERALVVSLNQTHPELITWKEKWPDSEQIFKDEHNQDYAPGRRFQAIQWDFSTDSPIPAILQDITKGKPTFGKDFHIKGLELKDFYKKNPILFERGADGYDTHFAERQFLERVFYPAFGKRGLSLLKPQFPFNDHEGRQRYADFVIDGTDEFAFEIEGSGFHAVGRIATEQHVDDVQRERSLTQQGFKVQRIAAKEVFTEPNILMGGLKQELRALLLADEQLKARLSGEADLPEVSIEEKAAVEALLLHLYQFPTHFRPLQLSLLHLLVTQREQLTDVAITVLDRSPIGPLAAMAIHELLTLIHQTEILYGITLNLPTQYRVVLSKTSGANSENAWREYLATHEKGLDEPCPCGVDFSSKPLSEEALRAEKIHVEVDLIDTTPPSKPFAINKASLSQNSLAQILRPLSVPKNKLRPKNWRKRPVDYFVRRFFGIPALRSTPNSRQWELLTKVVQEGKDVLGIMPTGSGKSMCFQLPAMILPGGVLVISPLRSLMRDQVSNLRGFGINGADYAASDLPTDEAAENLRHFFGGTICLLYISPERVQIRSFLQEMAMRAGTLNISLVAIDEAHCVSEWGHDFRPSYLRLPRFVKETLRAGDSRPPILAITATASPPVERDVRTILDIGSQENIIRAKSLDRRNLSLSVHFCPVEGLKSESLPQVMKEVIPNVLRKRADDLLGRGQAYENAGVIFAVYADPHGRTTYRDGIGAIWDRLTQGGIVESDLAKLHSSNVPGKCPECGSFTFRSIPKNPNHEDEGRYFCETCGEAFDKPDKPEDREWDKTVRHNQDGFKRNWFPLIVATKGYGMGVDKRNIRYIIHQGFASSLEAYYQEAGRAGRDDEHSHCAIVSHPVHQDCEREYFQSHRKNEDCPYPKCVEGQHLNNRTCPYGLPELCDFGTQVNFLRRSYPKVETVLSRIMEIWDNLVVATVRDVRIPHGQTEEEQNANERAVYRLSTLGLIRDYTIDYSLGLRNSKMQVEPWREIPLERVKENLIRELEKVHRIALDKDEDEHSARRKAAVLREKIEEYLQIRQRELFPNPEAERRAKIEVMLRLLVEKVHREVQKMRLETLLNLWNYTLEKDCKRRYLLQGFGYKGDQKCGFCDSCQPDLNFERERANTAPDEADNADVVHGVKAACKRFDAEEIDKVLESIDQRNLQTSVIGMAETFLESSPNNLAARFIAGKLRAQRGQGREHDLAFRHLSHGYNAADEEYRDRDKAKKFYEEAKRIDGEDAVELIDKSKGVFDNPDGHSFVYREFRQARPRDTRSLNLGTLVCAEKEAAATSAVCSEANFALLASILAE